MLNNKFYIIIYFLFSKYLYYTFNMQVCICLCWCVCLLAKIPYPVFLYVYMIVIWLDKCINGVYETGNVSIILLFCIINRIKIRLRVFFFDLLVQILVVLVLYCLFFDVYFFVGI